MVVHHAVLGECTPLSLELADVGVMLSLALKDDLCFTRVRGVTIGRYYGVSKPMHFSSGISSFGHGKAQGTAIHLLQCKYIKSMLIQFVMADSATFCKLSMAMAQNSPDVVGSFQEFVSDNSTNDKKRDFTLAFFLSQPAGETTVRRCDERIHWGELWENSTYKMKK